MGSNEDEERLRNHPGVKQGFQLTDKSHKRNPLLILYGVQSELKEKDAIEELIERNLAEITEEQKQLIKI